jgi:hypothetical protein
MPGENMFFFKQIGGHPRAPRGAKLGASYNQIDQMNKGEAILLTIKQVGTIKWARYAMSRSSAR